MVELHGDSAHSVIEVGRWVFSIRWGRKHDIAFINTSRNAESSGCCCRGMKLLTLGLFPSDVYLLAHPYSEASRLGAVVHAMHRAAHSEVNVMSLVIKL